MLAHYATIYEKLADAMPDASALVHGHAVVTWRDFDERAARLGGALVEAGLRTHSKVAIYQYNGNAYLETFYGALKVRAVPVNINYRYLDDELVHLFRSSDSEAVVYHASFAERIARIRDRITGLKLLVQVDDGTGTPLLEGAYDYDALLAVTRPAPRMERELTDPMFIFTGGTTGLPKGVLNPVGHAARSATNFAPGLGLPAWPEALDVDYQLGLRRDGLSPVLLPACPLMHSAGLTMGSLPALAAGGSVVTLTSPGLDPHEVWNTVEARGVTTLVIPGDAVGRPLLNALSVGDQVYDLSRLRTIVSAGVAWSANVKRGLLEYGPHLMLRDGCGSTEGAIGFRELRAGDELTTSTFTPVPGLRVLREDLTEVEWGTGERGRIATPTVSLGYYKEPDATAETFREIDGQRFAMAGDWAQRERDGSIVLLGRDATVINTGGEKVFGEEVEDVIKTLPGIADCLVVGVPDERFGERVAAVVSIFEGTTTDPEAIAEHVRARLASYKVPRVVALAPVVPRHANGKPDIAEAKRLAATAAACD